MRIDAPFSEVFTRALHGEPCLVAGLGASPEQLPMAQWSRTADTGDLRLLDRCEGATLDVGCGPGRLTEALLRRGHVALGIDVVEAAVALTCERGGLALRRDVFGRVPGEGRWDTALLADGNVGIGGSPTALVGRILELLSPGGRIVAEVAAPGVASSTGWASLETGRLRSRPFPWAVVGCDDAEDLARAAGCLLTETHCLGERWAVVLEARR